MPRPTNPNSEPLRSLQDNYIHEMVGIWPDTRERIPNTETITNIQGVKNGDQAAAERLIAGRLSFMYEKFVIGEASDVFEGHEPEDILQIGCEATIYAAHKSRLRGESAVLIFHKNIDRQMRYRARPNASPPLPQNEIAKLIESDRTAAMPSVEAEVFGHQVIAADALKKALAVLKPRTAAILTSYSGFEAADKIHEEIAARWNVSRSRVEQIIKKGHERIRKYELEHGLASGMAASLAVDDVVNLGLIGTDPEPQFNINNFPPKTLTDSPYTAYDDSTGTWHLAKPIELYEDRPKKGLASL